MEFNHGTELLELCEKLGKPISAVMKLRETEIFQTPQQEVEQKMRKALSIMKESVKAPLEEPVPSVGGLIGGEAKKLKEHYDQAPFYPKPPCTPWRFWKSTRLWA